MTDVLLIDDDPDLNQVVSTLLREEGLSVASYESADKINQVIRQVRPKLIILDYFLPGDNGALVATRLKSSSKTKMIPIIMASSNYGIAALAREAGVELFLPKPYDADQLISSINHLIKERGKRKPPTN